MHIRRPYVYIYTSTSTHRQIHGSSDHRSTDGHILTASDPQIRRSLDREIHRRTDSPILRSSDPEKFHVLRDAQIVRSSDPQIRRFTCPQILKSSDPQIHRSYKYTQILTSSESLIWGYHILHLRIRMISNEWYHSVSLVAFRKFI